MRKTISFLLALFAVTAAHAQERPQRVIRRGPPPEWLMSLPPYVQEVNQLGAAVKRDAFIVARVVQAVGVLDDFQKSAALQKAADHVEAARARATETPQASLDTKTAISKMIDLIERAKQQGQAAELPEVQRQILLNTHVIQRDLFAELELVRREKESLAEGLTKLLALNQQLDGAMTDALSSTFDFVKAGGK